MQEGLSRSKIVSLLKACGKQKDLQRGSSLHVDIIKMGIFDNDDIAGNALVSMYAKCGSLSKAQELFDNLTDRTVESWNALVAGYIEHGHCTEALLCFERMQRDGTPPDAITYICILKVCGNLGMVDKGREIHSQIQKKGLLVKDAFLGTAVVDMYAKCGLLAKAQEVFNQVSVRDAVTWNALISGYIKYGYNEEALVCFEQMQSSGIFPSDVTLVCILKVCGTIGAIERGEKMHAVITRHGLLHKNIALGNGLVDMYAKCGLVAKAREVFDRLPLRDVVTWSALIAGYAQQGHNEEALCCFQHMQSEGISPNVVTYVCILKACGNKGDPVMGQSIHIEIAQRGLLEQSMPVANALIDMYVKCGGFSKAHAVFRKISHLDVVSWTALIGGYAQHGLHEEALNCFKQMQFEGISPNYVTFVCILKICGSIGAVNIGEEIHATIVREGMIDKYPVVGNTLVDMYVKCGLLAKAWTVLDKLPHQDVVSWSGLIAGYAQHGHGEEALECFERMLSKGICPDMVSIVCTLKACACVGAIDRGKEIYEDFVRGGMLERQPSIATALIDMYAKQGLVAKAHEVLYKLPVWDVASWSALIAGYAQHGYGKEALNCFECMRDVGISPNAATFVCALKACASIGALERGQEIHLQVAREGLLAKDIVVGTALVDMYLKCGLLAKAQEVFYALPVRDMVLWCTLIRGYVQHGRCQEALECYEDMQLGGISPDTATFLLIMKACGIIGAVDAGRQIHAAIAKERLWEKDSLIGTTLVDMYAKCGLLAKAQELFDSISIRDVVSWNVLITGYALLGMAEGVFNLVSKMIGCVTPDLGTLGGVLNVCGRVGLLDKGQLYFRMLTACCEIIPIVEHYACMVDLFARAGHLSKALLIIEGMPFNANLAVWHTMLNACRICGNMEIGRHAFDHAVQLDEEDAAAYVCMSNLYMDTEFIVCESKVGDLQLGKQAFGI